MEKEDKFLDSIKMFIQVTTMSILAKKSANKEIFNQFETFVNNIHPGTPFEMKLYFNFLYNYSKGEDVSELKENLPVYFKNIFDKTLKELESDKDPVELLKKITTIAIAAKKSAGNDELFNQLKEILENIHNEAPVEMKQYFKFLQSYAKGEDVSELKENLSENMKNIFDSVLKELKF
jgi:hypothetical protein